MNGPIFPDYFGLVLALGGNALAARDRCQVSIHEIEAVAAKSMAANSPRTPEKVKALRESAWPAIEAGEQ
jgi:hypothetical protein